jgi:pimeloyl-ACP methyl ester carboxylesterase
MPFEAQPASAVAQAPRSPVTRWGRNTIAALVAVLALLFGTTAVRGAGASPAKAVQSAQYQAAVSLAPFNQAAFNKEFHQGMVPVEGGQIHYVIGGTGPALLLLHGWPETWWAWHKVMPDLAKTHTVIALDLPGLGQSTVPNGGFDAANTAHRVRQAVHDLGYNQIQILAHDVGALVAYPYARDFPTEVSRLAVLETPLNGFGLEGAYSLSWHFLFNASPAPIPERIIDNGDDVRTFLGMLFNGAHHPEAIDQQRYFRAYGTPQHRSAGYDYYRAFAQNAADNQANASKRLNMPVLAMGAQYVFGPAVAASFSAVANDVRQVVAPDTGHFIAEENPGFLSACANLFFGISNATPPAELAGCGR